MPPRTSSRAALPRPPDHAVALFRALFRGRTDVFARRWESARTRRSGYSPACANEWRRGVCGKPQVRCGACPRRELVPVTDQVILDHLQGRHVVGLYPLLAGDTCHLLAVDLDGDGWRDDARALAATCRALGLPVGIERSRSGDGAHAWLFFEGAVPAPVARALGARLLAETRGRHPALELASYDRLFPGQDALPRGGFGSLVALPLQGAARERGHTVFLDEALVPVPDQWAYLASIARVPVATVERMARERGERARLPRLDPLAREREAPWSPARPRGPSRPHPARPRWKVTAAPRSGARALYAARGW